MEPYGTGELNRREGTASTRFVTGITQWRTPPREEEAPESVRPSHNRLFPSMETGRGRTAMKTSPSPPHTSIHGAPGPSCEFILAVQACQRGFAPSGWPTGGATRGSDQARPPDSPEGSGCSVQRGTAPANLRTHASPSGPNVTVMTSKRQHLAPSRRHATYARPARPSARALRPQTVCKGEPWHVDRR